MITIKTLKKSFEKLEGKHLDKEGKVDAKALVKDGDYATFREAVCELQCVKLEDMSENMRLAFCINSYNMMVRHAFIEVGHATSNLGRHSFFDRVKYNFGGTEYSLNDIEDGILRQNKRAPFHYNLPFKKDDPRMPTCLKKQEPRIHFGLNCGAKSCPPVKFFTAEAVDEELRIAGMGFMEMEDNCNVDAANNTLWLSRIFSWYMEDFGETDKAVAAYVAGMLRGEQQATLRTIMESDKFKVRYLYYDWSDNLKNAKVWGISNADGLGVAINGMASLVK